jgi:ketosteroid isomerase-like protein
MRQIGKAAILAALSCAAACSLATIANTPIPDTKENRDVLRLLALYKSAVEAKDVDGIMGLVSSDYLDVSIPGRAIATKDYTGLKAALSEQFDKTRSIKLELHPRHLHVQGDQALIDYFYVVRYDPVLPTGAQWRSETDDARLKLLRQGGQWKIVSGL